MQNHTQENDIFKLAVENLFEGVYFVDIHRKITFWNKSAERITGYSADKVVGDFCSRNLLVHVDKSGNNLCKSLCPLLSAIVEGKAHQEETLFLHHRDGHRLPISVSISTIRDHNGTIIGAIEVFQEKIRETMDPADLEDLKNAAFIDALTGLPNRRYLEMKLKSVQKDFQEKNIIYGLLFMDLDQFKAINDEYGHGIGDDILKMIARTIGANIRKSDMIGRWGGEEFVAILCPADTNVLNLVANKLRMLVENSFLIINEKKIQVTVTVGAALATGQDTLDALLNRADRGLYQGKMQGRNRVIFRQD